MSLAVAIQMDPLETINIDTDTTFALALEAQRRGHGLYHYLPRELTYRSGRVVARARPFSCGASGATMSASGRRR